MALPNLIAKSCLCLMHKIYMNVAPIKICEMFSIINFEGARRDPQYFSIPYNRLHNSDHSLAYKGPLLYNKTVHAVNQTLPDKSPRLNNKFMTPFKTVVTKYLLDQQKLDADVATWKHDSFILYNLAN